MIFEDISNFNNLNDYLPILNGCINAELIIMNLVLNGVFKSLYLKKSYKINFYNNFKFKDLFVQHIKFTF